MRRAARAAEPVGAHRSRRSERAENARSAHRANRARRLRPRRSVVVGGVIGMVMAAGIAYAATNWLVGLNSGSSGEAQSGAVSNLTISAIASPAATNLLYPGGNGDVVITIANPNAFPVTITAVNLPTNTTFATGYTTSALSTLQTGCNSTTSNVLWNFSTATSGSAHTLTTPLTVGASGAANNPLVVTLTNDAQMTASAPAACEATFFSMPSLTGIVATGGSATSTVTPATDAWTS
jgi:hypothetical protein